MRQSKCRVPAAGQQELVGARIRYICLLQVGLMRLIDHIRAAIELHDDTEARIQYVLERYDAKRDSIRRQINREVAKQRKHVDTGSDERDAFSFDESEYQFQLAGEKPFSVRRLIGWRPTSQTFRNSE